MLTEGEGETLRRIATPFYWRGGTLPATPPDALGDPAFCREHGTKYPYMAGAMAGEISGAALVVALAREGILGSYGAGGVAMPQIAKGIDAIRDKVAEAIFAVNLIHAPHDPTWENDLVSLLIAKEVPLVEASAYIKVNLPLVRFRLHGIRRTDEGLILCPNRVIAKVSRREVAEQFFAPPPEALLAELVRCGEISAQQAAWGREIPLADDITVEADSGGHTDNRPTLALFPTMLTIRDRAALRYGGRHPLRLGLAGGIGTPFAAHGAFALGAAYIVTGSVNQACVEAGTSLEVKELLAAAQQADTAMAPSAALFEWGARVQVLKRGTMFPMRAARLYECYQRYPSLEEIPESERAYLETHIFRQPLTEVWRETLAFFAEHDPAVADKAQKSARERMALVFRSYLGRSSRWAVNAEAGRQMDYQVWCGPAIGAFNEWTRGTDLAAPSARRVALVACNFLYGAALLLRMQMLRCHGIVVRDPAALLRPLPQEQVAAMCRTADV